LTFLKLMKRRFTGSPGGVPFKPGCLQQSQALLCQVQGIFGGVERQLHDLV
jgi:hypothetical protein